MCVVAPDVACVAGVRLIRLDPDVDDHRRVIYRSGDLRTTTHADTEVGRGHRYAYAVQAVTSRGRVVGQSEVVWVRIPGGADVDVAALRLSCSIGGAGEAIGCGWNRPSNPGAAIVTLWRSVDGGAREIVERFRPDGPGAYP